MTSLAIASCRKSRASRQGSPASPRRRLPTCSTNSPPDLKAGNLSAAQQDRKALQKDLQTQPPVIQHHHHHDGRDNDGKQRYPPTVQSAGAGVAVRQSIHCATGLRRTAAGFFAVCPSESTARAVEHRERFAEPLIRRGQAVRACALCLRGRLAKVDLVRRPRSNPAAIRVTIPRRGFFHER